MPTTSTINQSFNGLFEFLRDAPVIAGDTTTLPFRFTQGIELRGELAALTRDVNIYSAFVNDQWQPVSSLTVNLGCPLRLAVLARRSERRRTCRTNIPDARSSGSATRPATCCGQKLQAGARTT